MTSEADEGSTTDVYELTCTDCPFETTVEGDCFDAIDAAEAHQEEHGISPMDHVVNFERRG